MTAESRRRDLYAGLTETLGREQADTLMSQLPSQPIELLATTDHLEQVETRLNLRIDGLEQRMDGLGQRMDRLEQRMDRLEQRMDKLFLTMLAGVLGMLATVVATTVFG